MGKWETYLLIFMFVVVPILNWLLRVIGRLISKQRKKAPAPRPQPRPARQPPWQPIWEKEEEPQREPQATLQPRVQVAPVAAGSTTGSTTGPTRAPQPQVNPLQEIFEALTRATTQAPRPTPVTRVRSEPQTVAKEREAAKSRQTHDLLRPVEQTAYSLQKAEIVTLPTPRSRDELRQMVVWSEILAAPLAFRGGLPGDDLPGTPIFDQDP